MLDPRTTIEQVALYLGKPWKLNRLVEPSDWRFEIIDGAGRGLFFRVDHPKKQFRISGQFPRAITGVYHRHCGSIGVGLTRPAKDIASDISRRLLPDYISAFDVAKRQHSDRRQQQEHMRLVAQSLVRVADGHISRHSGDDQCTVYFTGGEAKLSAHSNGVQLRLTALSEEQAIRIAASLNFTKTPP